MAVILSGTSFAEECWTDRDCPGARCIIMDQEGGGKGVCGESGQGAPSSKPLFRLKQDTETRPERNTKGKMCFGKADCDPGQACDMKPGQMYGVCR